MRLRVSNAYLPGVWGERVSPMGAEHYRDEITTHDGEYIGTIVYVSRKRRAGGTDYGWRPDKAPRARLTNMVDAVRALPRCLG